MRRPSAVRPLPRLSRLCRVSGPCVLLRQAAWTLGKGLEVADSWLGVVLGGSVYHTEAPVPFSEGLLLSTEFLSVFMVHFKYHYPMTVSLLSPVTYPFLPV